LYISSNNILDLPIKKANSNVLDIKKVVRINTIRNYTALIFAINAIINYFFNYTYSFYVTAIASAALIISMLLFSDKHIKIVRHYLTLVIIISISILNYIEGYSLGEYLYLFVLLIIAIFIFDYNEKKGLLFTFALIIASLLFIFIESPLHSSIQKLSENEERSTFLVNLFGSVLITFFITFFILRQNNETANQLNKKEQFLDALYNTSLDAVFIVDIVTLKIIDCNLQSAKLFDVDHSSFLLDKTIFTLLKPILKEDLIKKVFSNQKKSWTGEIICTNLSGTEFPGYVSIIPFLQGDLLLKKISIIDITDIKKVQTELTIAKDKAEFAMKTKSQFLSNMSHELRTPLNGIIGTANLLLGEASMPEQKEHFDLLKYSSEHMLNLINDVLDFSKIEANMMQLEKAPFNVKNFFNKIQSIFIAQYAQKNVLLLFDVDENLDRYFLADETRLSQVMSNLISNALKFTEVGKVVVNATILKSNSKTTSISISVTDSGVGISEQHQKIIFNSFTQGDTSTTRKFGGTGLGLSISKNIIEMYHGKLEVESKKNVGSKFYFTIDLDMDLSNKKYINENVLSSLKNLDGLKVLVAEDNKINMLVARKFLKKWNIYPIEAENGKIALKEFQQNNFDVLLVDLEMPEMDGYETITAIRKTNKSIPIIAFTAAVYDNIYTDLIAKGFTDYIQKPFRPEDLHRKLSVYAKVNSI
jgi:signal transduction histidine kinase/CheY-like chemotaxis protein